MLVVSAVVPEATGRLPPERVPSGMVASPVPASAVPAVGTM